MIYQDEVRKALDFLESFQGWKGKLIKEHIGRLEEERLQYQDKLTRRNIQIKTLKEKIEGVLCAVNNGTNTEATLEEIRKIIYNR